MPTLAPADQARVQRIRELRNSPRWASVDDSAKAKIHEYLSGLASSSLATDGTPGPAFREEQDAAAVDLPSAPVPPRPFMGVPDLQPNAGNSMAWTGQEGLAVESPATRILRSITPDELAAVRTTTNAPDMTDDQARLVAARVKANMGTATPEAAEQFRIQQQVAQMPGSVQSQAPKGFMDAAGRALGASAYEGLANTEAHLRDILGGDALAGVGIGQGGGQAPLLGRALDVTPQDRAMMQQQLAAQAETNPAATFAGEVGGMVYGMADPAQVAPMLAAGPLGRAAMGAPGLGRLLATIEAKSPTLARIVEAELRHSAGGAAYGGVSAAMQGEDLEGVLRGAGKGAALGAVGGPLMDVAGIPFRGRERAAGEAAPPASKPEVAATTRAGTPEVPPQETGTPAGVSDQTAPRDGIVPVTSAEALDAARAIRERQTGRRDLSPPATGVVAPTDSAPAAVPPTGTIDDVRAFAAAKQQRDAIRQAAADLDAKIASALGLAPGTDVGAVLDRATVKAEPFKGGAAARVPVQSEGGSAEALLNELRAMREGQVTAATEEASTVPPALPTQDQTDTTSSSSSSIDAVRPAVLPTETAATSNVDTARPAAVSESAVVPAAPSTSLDSMTPAQLRREAKARGVDSRGTKAQLLERLRSPAIPAPEVSREATASTSTRESEATPASEPAQPPVVSVAKDSSPKPSPATGAKEPWQMTRTEFDKGTVLHGTTKEFSGFVDPKTLKVGHGVTYFSESSPGRKTQAEHIADGPFGGKLVRAKLDKTRLKRFDPLNDPRAAEIMREAGAAVDKQTGKYLNWVEWPDMPDVARMAAKEGYTLFQVREPAVQGFSWAVADPKAIEIVDHRAAVTQALAEGKPVPPEVLADYPELAKAAPDPSPAAAPGKRAVSGSEGGGEKARKYTQIPKDWHGASLYAWNNANEVQLAKGKRLPAESRGAVRPMRSMPKAYRDSLGTVPTDATRLIDWIKSKTPEVWKLEGTAGRGKTLVPLELIDAAKEAVPDWQADVSAAQARRQARRDLIEKNRATKAQQKILDEARTWSADEWAEYEANNPAAARELLDMLDQQDIANGKETPDFAADIIDDAAKRARGEIVDEGIEEAGSDASAGQRNSGRDVGAEAGRAKPWLQQVSDTPPPFEPKAKEQTRGVFGQEGVEPLTGGQRGMFGDIRADAIPDPSSDLPGIRPGESVAAYHKRMGTADTPEMFGEKKPTTADRVVSKLDKIAADAQERIKQRGGVQRGKGFKGSRSGETTLIGDTVDTAVVVAAKAVSSAIKGGQALTRLVESTIKELGVTADKDHVRRIARGLIRDTLAEKPENHADAFERAAGALRDKYSREPKASEIKPLIRENTGQAADPKTITEPQALRASMSKAEKAASIAYRAGEADATARGKAELADLVQKLNARTMEKEDARKELVRIIRETVPLSERGKLLTRIRDASNSDDVAAGVDMARDVIALYEGRQANSFVRSNSGKGLTNKMTQANRDAVQAARGIASAAWQKLQDASNVAERRQAADELITAQNQIKAAMHDQKIGERVLIGGQKIDAAIAREDLSNGIRATGKLRPTDELGNVKEEGKSGKALATLQDPVTLMRTVDGKADGSGVASKLWTDIRAAYTRASGRIQKARDMAHEAAIQAGYNGIGDLLEKVSGTRGEQGRKFIEVGVGGRKKLTLGEAMKLYAMDPETKEQVINGRKINWDNSRTAPAFNVTAADFAAIARALTPEQRKLVNALKAIRESFRGDLAKAHKRLKGFEPPWVEQYEPRRVNPEGTDPGKALGGSATEQLLEDAGFLKAREGGITPLLVGDFLTDWTRSIDGMARFTEMAEPLRAARLVLQDPRTKGVVTKYKGEYANKLVDELFSQFGSAASDANALSGLGSKIIGNVSKAATQLNPRSWGRQLGGVLAAASEAPPDVVAAGMPMMFNRGVRERMVENSPYLAARASMPDALRFYDLEQPGAVRGQRTIQGMARVFGDAVTSLKRGDVKDAAKNASDAFNFIRAASYMDEAPAAMLWAGFEAKAQKEGKSVDWVRENVERIMQSTQNPSESIDGALMKSVAKGTWFEPFTAFKGDSTKAYNRLKRAAEEGGFKSRTFWKAASGVLASALWSGVVTALLGNQTLKLVGGAVTGNADDEDTQKRLKNAVLMGADQSLRDVAGVVPIVGDNLYEWTLGSFIRPHGGAMQNAFDNPTSGSLSRLAIGMNGFGRGVYRTLTAEDEDTREKAGKALLKSLESAAEGAASATGIPLGPVYGMGKALIQGARGDAEK